MARKNAPDPKVAADLAGYERLNKSSASVGVDRFSKSYSLIEDLNRTSTSIGESYAKPKQKPKSDVKKYSKVKTMLVYGQSAVILLLFLAALYLQYKISFLKKTSHANNP
ncbi:unnamed protein product [Blepharisma stoltei]|uniref:Uncharacterized protein n=1 Tax=Blepharisma stoltei TaxID=1481888 RepID=A0AAU9IYQ4_9CILI|nr:unnamed protein product [Blepharisma stoltei]